jgi:hypothetical protein
MRSLCARRIHRSIDCGKDRAGMFEEHTSWWQ